MPAPRTGILMPSIFLPPPSSKMRLGRGRAMVETWPKEQSQEKVFFFDSSQNDTELIGIKGETNLSTPLCTTAPAQPLQTGT